MNGDFSAKFGEFLKEALFKGPAAHITMVSLKQRTQLVTLRLGIVAVGICEGEGPGEFEVLAVVDGELGSGEVVVVVSD
jgi:hypothetical protein